MRRRRGRGLRQWQRAPQAPRERQAGAANDERDEHEDGTMERMSCGFSRQRLLTAGCYSGIQFV